MGDRASIADRAVDVLAAVAAMDKGVGLEHSNRHQVWTLKRLAEAAILDGFRQARELAYVAEQMRASLSPGQQEDRK